MGAQFLEVRVPVLIAGHNARTASSSTHAPESRYTALLKGRHYSVEYVMAGDNCREPFDRTISPTWNFEWRWQRTN